jgi:hypothetical protein
MHAPPLRVRRWSGLPRRADAHPAHMASLSGTVILCDQIYQAQGGKYVIAGTYTTIEVHCKDLRNAEHLIGGLNLYLRLRPERVGQHQCEILVRNEHMPPWSEPVLRHAWQADVSEGNMRLLEMPRVLPPFIVRVQAPPETPNQDSLLVKFSLEFRIDGEVVATTPLDVKFVQVP